MALQRREHWRIIRTSLLLTSLILALAACGGFKAVKHPDQIRTIASVEDLEDWVDANNANPKYRKAKVRESIAPLNLKAEPNFASAQALSHKKNLNPGESLLVVWPENVANNYIQVVVSGQKAWVPHKSRSGRTNFTYDAQSVVPVKTVPGYQVVQPQRPIPRPGPVVGGETMNPGRPADIAMVNLSSSAVNEAFAAIRAVDLQAAEVPTCTFDPLVGNSSGKNNCYREIIVSSKFRDYLGEHGYACAQEASQKAFGRNADRVLFHSSSGGQVSRNRRVSGSGRKSTHSIGHALDLFGISLYFGASSRKVVLHKNHTDGSSAKERENHKFYWAYVNCWRDRIKKYAPCNCGGTWNGAITYLENSAHHNHIHMSVPFCERKRFNVSCV